MQDNANREAPAFKTVDDFVDAEIADAMRSSAFDMSSPQFAAPVSGCIAPHLW
jgi:hypothetical protein